MWRLIRNTLIAIAVGLVVAGLTKLWGVDPWIGGYTTGIAYAGTYISLERKRLYD